MADSQSVAELIEINLMFAQLELSLGGDSESTSRALDHIMEALKELRQARAAKPQDCDPLAGKAS